MARLKEQIRYYFPSSANTNEERFKQLTITLQQHEAILKQLKETVQQQNSILERLAQNDKQNIDSLNGITETSQGIAESIKILSGTIQQQNGTLEQLIQSDLKQNDSLNKIVEAGQSNDGSIKQLTGAIQQQKESLDGFAQTEMKHTDSINRLTEASHNDAASIKLILSDNAIQQKALLDQLIQSSQHQTALINEIIGKLPDQKRKVLWKLMFERNLLKGSWAAVSEDKNIFAKGAYAEKYVKLVKGLDDESMETVANSLSKCLRIVNSNELAMDIYTEEEKENIRLLYEEYYPYILKLSDSVFAYKHYLLPINHFESGIFYRKHGIYELNHPEIIEGKTIIDVGAFVGDSAIVLNDLRPRKIFSFEALPENYEIMKKTIELNDLDNIVPENLALGEAEGTLKINTIKNLSQCSTCLDNPYLGFEESVNVPMISLDSYVEQHGIDDVKLIKIDIEGAETGFLKGAKKTIIEQRPVLLLSIYHSIHDYFELKPMVEEWCTDYTFKIRHMADETAVLDTVLIAEPKM